MTTRFSWKHTGEWAELLAVYTPGVPYILPYELLPDADCENCKHMNDAQDEHCYIFLERPGDKCAMFTKKEE